MEYRNKECIYLMISLKKIFTDILLDMYALGAVVSAMDTKITTNTNNISSLQTALNSATTITTADATPSSATAVTNAAIKQCRLLKIGKLVFCNLVIQSNATDFIPKDTTLFTIPEGYRPAINNLPGGIGYDSSNIFHVTRFRVNADGVINYADYNNMKVLQLNFFWKIP